MFNNTVIHNKFAATLLHTAFASEKLKIKYLQKKKSK